jgi:Undecaprenyl-phosphate glucose phosphotransferase
MVPTADIDSPRRSNLDSFVARERSLPRMSPAILYGLRLALDTASFQAIGIATLAGLFPAILDIGQTYLYVCLLLVLALARPEQLAVAAPRRGEERQLMVAVIAWSAIFLSLLLLTFLLEHPSYAIRPWIVVWYLGGLAYLVVSRWVMGRLAVRWADAGRLGQRVAVIGAGPEGVRLVRTLINQTRARVQIVGIYDDRHGSSGRVPSAVFGHRVVGPLHHLAQRAEAGDIDMIVVALPLAAVRRTAEIVKSLRSLPVDVCVCTGELSDALPSPVPVQLGPVVLLRVFTMPLKDWAGILKAVEDLVLAGLGLILLGPLLLVIAALIKLDSPGPVLFRQKRFGFNNQPIEVLKFRTMHVDQCDPSGAQRTVRNDRRVTRVGRVLRRISLDELPQLVNVLRRDMSVIGPRAHPVAMRAAGRLYHELVDDYAARHRVRPGITGWAQVNGLRGEVGSVEAALKRLDFDLYYVENHSILFDLKIVALTFAALWRDDAY